MEKMFSTIINNPGTDFQITSKIEIIARGSLATHSQTHKHNGAHSIINYDTDKCCINGFYNNTFPDENAFFKKRY